MKQIQGDIWEQGHWIVIPTNGSIKKNGEAVMGRGLALQAKQRFPDLPRLLGERLKKYGNVVFVFIQFKLITFPVKEDWYENASFALIEKSCKELKQIFKYNLSNIPVPIYLPRVGCGSGNLNWDDVKLILDRYLDEKFIVCDKVDF